MLRRKEYNLVYLVTYLQNMPQVVDIALILRSINHVYQYEQQDWHKKVGLSKSF